MPRHREVPVFNVLSIAPYNRPSDREIPVTEERVQGAARLLREGVIPKDSYIPFPQGWGDTPTTNVGTAHIENLSEKRW